MGKRKSPVALVTGKGQKPRDFLRKIRPCLNCNTEMEKSGDLLHCPKCGRSRTVWGSPVRWELKEKYRSSKVVEKLKEEYSYNLDPAYVSSALEDLYEAIENFENKRD